MNRHETFDISVGSDGIRETSLNFGGKGVKHGHRKVMCLISPETISCESWRKLIVEVVLCPWAT